MSIQVPWPITNSPGQEPQEGTGRLINVHPDSIPNDGGVVWRRAPGARVFARTPSVGSAAGSATALGRALIEQMVGSAAGTSTAIGYPGIGVAGTAAGQSEATAVGTDEELEE